MGQKKIFRIDSRVQLVRREWRMDPLAFRDIGECATDANKLAGT